MHVFCHDGWCLIPSTHAFLIVSAFFKFYKSALECRTKSLKSWVPSFVPSMPQHDKAYRIHCVSFTAYHRMIAPAGHRTDLGLCDCKSPTFNKASRAAAMGKHFVWIGGPSRCVKSSNHSISNGKINVTLQYGVSNFPTELQR